MACGKHSTGPDYRVLCYSLLSLFVVVLSNKLAANARVGGNRTSTASRRAVTLSNRAIKPDRSLCSAPMRENSLSPCTVTCADTDTERTSYRTGLNTSKRSFFKGNSLAMQSEIPVVCLAKAAPNGPVTFKPRAASNSFNWQERATEK